MLPQKIILPTVIFLALVSCTSRQPFRLIHDDDGDSMWDYKHLTVERIDSAVSIVAGTGVTSYAICAGSDYVHYGSRFADSSFLKDSGLKERGVDFIRTVLAKTREKGMESILTYRMNDLHFTDTLDVPDQARKYMSKWWWDHPQFWLNENVGWHTRGAYDFAHKAVRDRKVDIMTEQVDLYGDVMDVYLMDFLRFFFYFKKGEGRSHTADLTEMVRRMRVAVDSLSQVKGHKILLAARVAPNLEDNLEKGIDVREWLKEGLVDFLSLGIHMYLDGQTPIKQFRDELGEDLHVPIYACGCNIMYSYNDAEEAISDGMIRSWSSVVLDQGADGLQSFNYYFSDYILRDGIIPSKGGMTNRTFHPSLYTELTSLDKLEGRNKLYWLSDGQSECDLTPNTPLPMEIVPGKEEEIVLYVGDRMQKYQPEKVILFFRTSADVPIQVTLNGREMLKEEPAYPELYDRNTCLKEGQRQWSLTFPSDAVRHGDNLFRFKSGQGSSPVELVRVELALQYGPVEQNGYF